MRAEVYHIVWLKLNRYSQWIYSKQASCALSVGRRGPDISESHWSELYIMRVGGYAIQAAAAGSNQDGSISPRVHPLTTPTSSWSQIAILMRLGVNEILRGYKNAACSFLLCTCPMVRVEEEHILPAADWVLWCVFRCWYLGQLKITVIALAPNQRDWKLNLEQQERGGGIIWSC